MFFSGERGYALRGICGDHTKMATNIDKQSTDYSCYGVRESPCSISFMHLKFRKAHWQYRATHLLPTSNMIAQVGSRQYQGKWAKSLSVCLGPWGNRHVG